MFNMLTESELFQLFSNTFMWTCFSSNLYSSVVTFEFQLSNLQKKTTLMIAA